MGQHLQSQTFYYIPPQNEQINDDEMNTNNENEIVQVPTAPLPHSLNYPSNTSLIPHSATGLKTRTNSMENGLNGVAMRPMSTNIQRQIQRLWKHQRLVHSVVAKNGWHQTTQ